MCVCPSDLQDQDESARAELLTGVGLSEEAVDDVTAFLSAFPELAVAARCEVDGEDEIMEQDPIHCRVRRHAASSQGLTARVGILFRLQMHFMQYVLWCWLCLVLASLCTNQLSYMVSLLLLCCRFGSFYLVPVMLVMVLVSRVVLCVHTRHSIHTLGMRAGMCS